MSAGAEVVVGLVVLIGLVGSVIQIFPGSGLVALAVGVWGVVTGGTAGWTIAIIAVVTVVAAGVGQFLWAGRYLSRAGVPHRTLLIGALVGIIGFFLIPVAGLPLGFVLAVYLTELARRRDQKESWRATVSALKAAGLTILIEVSGSMLIVGAWIIGLLLT